MAAIKRNLTADLRDALIEAKESMNGKRKLNTLGELIEELREDYIHRGTGTLCKRLGHRPPDAAIRG